MDYFTQQEGGCGLKAKLTKSCSHFHSWPINAEYEEIQFEIRGQKEKVMNRENMDLFIIVQYIVHRPLYPLYSFKK